MQLYAGIDLHSNNLVVAIVDEKRRRLFKKRLANDLGLLLRVLEPYREELVAVAVESTYNWYWPGGRAAGGGLPGQAGQSSGHPAIRGTQAQLGRA